MVKKIEKKEYPIGLCLHTRNESGDGIKYQGEVIGVDGNVLFVQLYSWVMGEPTIVKAMTKDFVYSDKCILYATNTDMNSEYDKHYAIKREK
jgi:hypothetical protein